MTVNALEFYPVAVLIVFAAAAAVGLPSLRLSSFAGAGVVVLIAVLDVVSGQYLLAAIALAVPGVAAAIVVRVLRHEQYRALGAASSAGSRWQVAAPVALLTGVVLVVTLALVGQNWFEDTGLHILIGFIHPTLLTVLFSGAPYALAVSAVLVVATVGAGLVIGRRSADEQTLDQHLAARREREERARRRREDREQGRRRPAKDES
jgi:hypothetical protein